MIKYATIGRGMIVDHFIAAAFLTGRFELSAVYSRSAEGGREFAYKHGCDRVYTDINDLAADREIQAVYIASPNSCHAYQSRILLNSGKHIICEKPIAVSAKEYEETKRLADSLGLIYMEAIIPQYADNHDDIVKAVSQIGNIAMARIDYCQLTSRYERLKKGEHVNIFDMSLAAGALMDLGVYCVYAAVDLLGMPESVKAEASFLENGADSGGSAIFGYKKFTAAITYSKVGQSISACEIVGDKGSVIIERIGLYQGAYLLKDGMKTALFTEQDRDSIMSCEANAFADFIMGNKLCVYERTSALCRNVHICMDRIKQSAEIKYYN